MNYLCPHCSRPFAGDAMFCPNCGGRLSMSARRTPMPFAVPPLTRPTLNRRNILLGGLALLVLALAGGFVYANIASMTNLLQNPSLETATGSTPRCWALGGYGTNTFTWTRTSDAHTGSFAESLNITSYTSGDRKFVNAQDSGACAPAISAGHTYTMTAWYKSTRQPYVFVYYRTSAGIWVYWIQSAKLAIASSWTQETYTTPAVPAGATNLSIGMGINGVGSLTMDDFGLVAGALRP
jgi:DNA-directed RNA polymerase subunit RPC12/RpoP